MKGDRLLLVASCLLATALTSCGSGSESTTPSTAASAATRAAPPPVTTPQEQRAAERKARRKFERSLAPNPYPKPSLPPGHPGGDVTRVIIHEVKRGHGPPLQGDESVYVDFVKSRYRTGDLVESAWGRGRGASLRLKLEAPGIERGMTGMRPGGRRTILLPSSIVGDVHGPDGNGWEPAVMQVVLRAILSPTSG